MQIRALVPLLLLSAVACAEDSLPIYVYPCPEVAKASVIDGRLDDPAWQQAPLVSGFAFFGKPEVLAPVQTSVRVVYDADALVLGVRCEEPSMDLVTQVSHPRDEHAIFSTEALEIFVDPEHSNSRYYQFAVNAAGSLYDSRREDPTWNSEATTATFLGPDFWSLELSIPWKSLEVQPRAGAVVGFNVCRDRHIGEQRQWTMWAHVTGGFHDPVRFGHLVLSGTPEIIGGLGEELRKGDRHGAIVVFSAEGFAQTTYRELAAQSIAGLERLVADLGAEADRERDAATAAEIRRRLADHADGLAALKREAAGTLDAATWTALDLRIQSTTRELGQLLWEARLSALLSAI